MNMVETSEILIAVKRLGEGGSALAYAVPEASYDAFLKAVDTAARSAGAEPVEEVSLAEGATFTESELNRAWLDEGGLVVGEAEAILGGEPGEPAR